MNNGNDDDMPELIDDVDDVDDDELINDVVDNDDIPEIIEDVDDDDDDDDIPDFLKDIDDDVIQAVTRSLQKDVISKNVTFLQTNFSNKDRGIGQPRKYLRNISEEAKKRHRERNRVNNMSEQRRVKKKLVTLCTTCLKNEE